MADSEQLLITLGVQDKGSSKQISAITKEIKALDKEFKSASSVSKGFEKSQEGLKTKLTYLEKSYTANNAKLEAYKKKMQETKDAIQKKEETLNKLTSAEEKDEKAIAKASEQLEKMKQSLRGTEQNITLTENELKRLENELNATNTALQNQALDQYKEKVQSLGKSVQDTGDKISKIGSGMSSVGSTMMAVSAPMVAFAGYAVKAGTDFEYGMKQVQATCNASEEDLGRLSDKAKEVGKNTKWSATDAADGLNYMAMAGWKTDQMIAGLEPTVNLATAANTDLGTTCDIVTDALTAFGMTAEDTGHFTDIIASASSNANTNVEMLGESFKYVAPLCGSLNYSAEDAALALGLMANAGIKSSQSGTSLKTALVNMTSPTDAMAGVMGKLGIEITKEDGSMKSLHETLDMLREKFKVFSNDEIDANFKKYSDTLGMTRQELEALSVEEQAEAIAKGVGAQITGQMTEAQIQQAEASMLSKEELKKLTAEQKLWQIQAKLGQQALYGLTQEEQASAAATLFGKESMAGMLSIINASESDYNKLSSAINNCDGETKRMADTMANSTQGKIDSFHSKLEALGIKIADGLLPHINSLMDKGMELIDWFSSLDTGTQQAIVNFGLMTFATGGALVAIGKLTTGIGSMVTTGGKFIEWIGKSDKAISILSNVTKGASAGASTLATATKVGAEGAEALATATSTGAKGTSLLTKGLALLNPTTLLVAGGIAAVATGIAAYNTYQDEMNQNILKTTDEMSIWEKCINALTGSQAKSKQELQEMGLVYKDFGENIGEEFKNKVEESTKTLNDFSINLREINLDGVLTQEECDGVVSRVDSMVDSAIQAINAREEESSKSLKDLFTVDDNTIDENEQKVLEYINRTSEVQKEETQQLRDEINQIQQGALEDKRSLNEEEIKAVEEKANRIKQIELENVSSTNEEMLYAKNEFTARVESIDLESASNLLQEKAKLRDEEIVQIKAQYDTQIELLKEKAENATGADKEALDQQIVNLEEARQQKIDLQNQTYDEYMQIIDEKNPEIAAHIDATNGEILTREGEQCAQRLEQMRSMYTGMDEITTSGYYSLQNNITGAMEQCYVTVDEATGRIVGCWSSASGQVGAANENIAQSTKSSGQEVYNSCSKMQADVQMMANGTVTASGQVVSANGQVVGSLQNVTTAADGTKTGIVDLNGTPVQVTTNADGVIQQCKDMTSNIEAVPTKHQTIFEFIASGWEAVKNKISELTSGGGVQSNAKGTYGNMKGFSYLNEDGWELASNNNITMINDNFGYGSGSGASIRTHMQSVADMKAEVNSQVHKALSEIQLGNSTFTAAGIQQLAKIASKMDYIIIDNKSYHKDYINEIAGLSDMTEYQAHQLQVGFTDLETSNDGYYQSIINASRDYNNSLNEAVNNLSSSKNIHTLKDEDGDYVNYSDSQYKEMLKRTLDINEAATSWIIGENEYTKDEIKQIKIISDYLGGISDGNVKMNKDEVDLLATFKDDVKYSDEELKTLFERIEANGDAKLKSLIDTTRLNVTQTDKAVQAIQEFKVDWSKDFSLDIGGTTYNREQLTMKKTTKQDENGNWIESFNIDGKSFTKESIEAMIAQQQQLNEKVDDIISTSTDYNKNTENSIDILDSSSLSSFDYNKLHDVVSDCVKTDLSENISNALIQGLTALSVILNADVDIDVNGIIDKAVDKSIKTLNKNNRSSKVSKGL